MREYGIKNTQESTKVTWREGTGENTTLPNGVCKGCFFGSSFNVVDQSKALDESRRVLMDGGIFACMWNHRDLEDPLQKEIENIFKGYTPNYDYGKRRESTEAVIEGHGGFSSVGFIEAPFVVNIDRNEWIDAWNSHATVARQIGKTIWGQRLSP